MREEPINEKKHFKHVDCPGCQQPIKLEMRMELIDDSLFAWFEGICVDCCHKVVDPLPKVRLDLNEAVINIISN